VQPRVLLRIVTLLLALFSLSLFVPAVLAWALDEPTQRIFLLSAIGMLLFSVALWFPVRSCRAELRLRDGFLVVVLSTFALSLAGSVPFMFTPGLSFVDALFESASGLTSTGATVVTGLDSLPRSTLIYRQILQWLGGMGVIVLAVAVLPMLAIGGMQAYRALTPGPMKFNRLTARIVESARGLWYLYIGLTAACAIAYWLAGMTAFDAIAHSMSTISLGGFSTHDDSFAYFDDPVIEAVGIVFMLIAGINFAWHFIAWRHASLQPYRDSQELRTYGIVLAVVSAITIVVLSTRSVTHPDEAARHGVFQAVSMGVTAGCTTTEYHRWPSFLPLLLIMVSFIGGCAGSTGGGLKVIRVLLLLKQAGREIRRLIHPNASFSVKIGDRSIGIDVIDSVWGYFALYMVCFCIMTVLLAMVGVDLVTAFSAVAACINNLGPGLGEVAYDYAGLGDFAKLTLCMAMLIGRLEVFSLLILLTPEFWKK
jgi:trk system potassium uptake protein TrkH